MKKYFLFLAGVFFADLIILYVLIETINRTLWLFPKINYQSLIIASMVSLLGSIIYYVLFLKNKD